MTLDELLPTLDQLLAFLEPDMIFHVGGADVSLMCPLARYMQQASGDETVTITETKMKSVVTGEYDLPSYLSMFVRELDVLRERHKIHMMTAQEVGAVIGIAKVMDGRQKERRGRW